MLSFRVGTLEGGYQVHGFLLRSVGDLHFAPAPSAVQILPEQQHMTLRIHHLELP